MTFVEMELAGIKRYVTEHQVRILEQIGWKRNPGADQSQTTEKATSQSSPKTKPKTRTKRT